MIQMLKKTVRAMRRLARDEGGNTLIITAFLLFPMIGMIGSGVDMSRAYMVKTRLQSACDAGVLAGRKAMGQVGSYNTAAQSKANTMFNFNFNGDGVKVTNTSFTTAANTEGQVNGNASTKLPTLIMKTFGYTNFDLTVTCSAELQIANADIMFVLDTTGSMAWCPNGSSSCNGGSGSRIAGIREAVADFHKTIAAAVTNDTETRIRYGFVPYSSSVNVSGLIAAGQFPASYLANSHTYQTRLAVYDTPVYTVSSTTNVGSAQTQVYNSGADISSNQCNDYADNNYPSSGTNPLILSGSKPGTVRERIYYNPEWGYSGAPDKKGNTRSCRRTYQDRDVNYVSGGFSWTKWRYTADPISTVGIKTGSTQIATGTAGTVTTAGVYDPVDLLTAPGAKGIISTNSTWQGCIEERATVRNFAMSPVPSGATDLDINSAPTSEATRWKPLWEHVEYYRYNNLTSVDSTTTLNSVNANCPETMREFTAVDTVNATTVPTWLTNYLDSLQPSGSTYHDIGMIWGARLGSPRGIFKSIVDDGVTKSVSRHIIFMTDGEMAPTTTTYSSYGQEIYDNRVAPSGTNNSTLTDYHSNRFLAACEAAKAEGYMIWTVSFGTGMTDNLRKCSSDNRAYESSSTTALKDAFKAIASQIADLRLNK
ncbi:TadE/TadG family protein [Sphingorhabdus soli]|uniref:TadE/TadG family protein n=1 Tax=Flavisphingopyxis soli TaxID=2601267 RepID=A0A5C6U7V0_9SPHN|nr:TadE/TadG family type IV pilus assembly protein [Sphingorhabdus soli]TXC69087.1 TadE/TadG family protein [Sphingorhabdus soli]